MDTDGHREKQEPIGLGQHVHLADDFADCRSWATQAGSCQKRGPGGSKMSLKKATLWATIGLVYTFALRTAGTFLLGLFRKLVVAQVTTILSLLAALTAVLFFVYFFKDYVQKGQARLQRASVLAIMGTAAVFLLQIKGLFLVFDRSLIHLYNISPYLLKLMRPHSIEPIVVWGSSILILVFFAVFYKETILQKKLKLKRATLIAAIGSAIAVLLRTFILFNSLSSRQVRWFSDLPKTMALIFFPVIAFSFLANLYFLIFFYKEQKEIG